MLIHILSLFPAYFQGPFDESIVRRAREQGVVTIHLHDIRDFARGKHRRVDDRPYGGGPGMLMMPGPVVESIRAVKTPASKVIYLSPKGKTLDAPTCERLAKESHLIVLCGHYEGIDQRAIEAEVDEEISIGDYVLSNGCAAAIVLVDATLRFVPGVLGNEEAAEQDSFQGEGGLEAPQYTRPVSFEGKDVPEVLRSGNHQKIRQWQQEQASQATRERRPDLLDF